MENPEDRPGHAPSDVPVTVAVPVVAIGASAGGLEALERFLRHVPAASGMAFVVIQHLDPNHQGMLVELLQRVTDMPVAQITDGVAVESDHVYVIAPNRDLSILGNRLYLFEPEAARGQHLPIDFFLRTLAADRGTAGIAVILSGMGSDGSLGLAAIREAGGMTLVQTPESAGFDSMPHNAIAAGQADIIALPEEMPARIAALHSHPVLHRQTLPGADAKHAGAIDKVLVLLRERTGHDFSLYKRNVIHRRVERRMVVHQLERIADYVRYLRENSQEVDLLFRELLIGVTSFFRDPLAWDYLLKEVLPGWFAAHPEGRTLRAWIVACSTGEEAYSLAMVFKEALDAVRPLARFALQVFATDLDVDAIQRARAGIFPANIAADVAPARLRRFFVEEGQGFRVTREIREMVTFAPQNVVSDPPFTKLDLLSCRNLLIYMSAELQGKLLPLFHYSLCPGGILFLGSAESAAGFADLFAPLEARLRIYHRQLPAGPLSVVEFPSRQAVPVAQSSLAQSEAVGELSLESLAEQLILRKFAPAAVLVNSEGDIVYVSGRTGPYLEPAAGKANWNVYAMARRGLQSALSNALLSALHNQSEVHVPGLRIEGDGGAKTLRTVDLTVHPVSEPAALAGLVMIVFRAAAAVPARVRMSRSACVAAVEQARQAAQAQVQTVREQMQTTQEELKSANEELQSINEELQSSNEELSTSKEEMQSMNEELQTVNAELQARIDELSRANDDMQNLLNSTDIATIFLDGKLRLRRFTTQVGKLFRLIPSDRGRLLSDIVCDLDYPDLSADARQVLQTLVFSEKEIATRDGRWFKVRIMPYRTVANVIDGVVVTLAEITIAKQLEARLRALPGEH